MRVNCNISAIVANNSLGKSENALSTAIERLSSGLRINHAEDDAAGMAISKKMHAQIKGLKQASQNSSDGISVVQTAESALGEVENMLQRARELAVQAADGSYNDEDRVSIQKEIDQICSEIDRVSTDTEFNTMPLLDGTLSRKSYSDVSGVNVISTSTTVAAGKYSFTITQKAEQASNTAAAFTGTVSAAQAGVMTVNGTAISIDEGDTAESVYAKLITAGDKVGVSISGTDASGAETDINNAEKINFANNAYGYNETLEISFSNDSLATLFGMDRTNVTHGEDCKIDKGEGFSSTVVITENGNNVKISDVNSFEMKIEIPESAVDGQDVNLKVTDMGIMSIQVGANEGQQIDIDIPKVDTHTLGLDDVNISTSRVASLSIEKFDNAISQISSVRSRLGAYQNRMETTVQSINAYNENINSALSRIEDCDMAEEMTEYTSQNVITQAATSVLSQANERPQTVLQLLQ